MIFEEWRTFASELKSALDTYHPTWAERHDYKTHRYPAEPPLGVWPDSLENWVTASNFPQRKRFKYFLSRAGFPEPVEKRLLELYDRASQRRRLSRQLARSSAEVYQALYGGHGVFVGRTAEVDHLMQVLQDDDRPQIVAVYGLGGMGKTALMREIGRRCQQQGLFRHFIWLQARQEIFEDGKIRRGQAVDLSADSILAAICTQVDRTDLLGQPADTQIAALREYFAANPTLVLLDNLDTAAGAETAIPILQSVLTPDSRVLVTGRFQAEHYSLYRYVLGRLSQEDGVRLIRAEGDYTNNRLVREADEAVLCELHDRAGGLPLALRLVVGQLHYMPFDLVTRYLDEAQVYLPTEEIHPNYEFYKFIYQSSWQQLDHESKKLMVVLARFSAEQGGTVQAVQQVSGLPMRRFQRSLTPLLKLSLVDKSGSLGRERLELHPLTRRFVLGDIVKAWDS